MQMCIEPNYGSINQDGYVRVLDKPRSQGGRLVMHHRLAWERVNGKIPDGYEINHKCKNRRCSNLDHLGCLSVAVHRAKDNRLRYQKRRREIREYCDKNPSKTQGQVADVFGVSQGGVSLILQNEEKE